MHQALSPRDLASYTHPVPRDLKTKLHTTIDLRAVNAAGVAEEKSIPIIVTKLSNSKDSKHFECLNFYLAY